MHGKMPVTLKGLHSSKKILADGSVKTYFYAWKNGPRMKEAWGTPAFAREFEDLRKKRREPDKDTVSGLIATYRQRHLPRLGEATQRDYKRYLDMIEEEFGTMSIKAVEERGSRAMFEEWRDGMKHTPRKADLAWTVLQLVFSKALKSETITRNPCEAGGRLAETGTRRHIIWKPVDIAKFKESAPKHVLAVFMAGLWTGQRQGDILDLTWANYDGKHIRLKQSKGGRNVTVKVAKELKSILDGLRPAEIGPEVEKSFIFRTAKTGEQWTSDGFRSSWAKALFNAKISGLTFHDLRGSFITIARRSGNSIDDIADATGHSVKDVRSILEEHYLADNEIASDAVILKMERREREQSSKLASNRSKPQTK